MEARRLSYSRSCSLTCLFGKPLSHFVLAPPSASCILGGEREGVVRTTGQAGSTHAKHGHSVRGRRPHRPMSSDGW